MSDWGITINTPTSGAVLTTAQVKKQLEIATADTSHDTYVDLLVTAAVDLYEKQTRHHLLTRTQTLTCDDFPDSGGIIYMPFYPLSSVTSIKYDTSTADDNTMTSTKYIVSTHTMPPRISLQADESDWPDTQDEAKQVRILCVSGEGTASNVDEVIKTSLKRLIAYWFDNRSSVELNSVQPIDIPFDVQMIWNQYKMGDTYLRVT